MYIIEILAIAKGSFGNYFQKQFEKIVFENYFMIFYRIKVYLKI